MALNNNRVVCGMVLGEASESDDSDDNAPTEFSNSTAINFGQSTTAETTSANKKTSRRHKLKYNTLLHYKLRENNVELRNDMVSTVELPVSRATARLQEALQIQTKTRASLHEMPRYLHQLSVALVGIQDHLPSICNAKIMPNYHSNINNPVE